MEDLYGNGISPISEEQVPDFLAGKPAYAMGVNSKGMPVFEDPDAAFADQRPDLLPAPKIVQSQNLVNPLHDFPLFRLF